MNQWSLSMTLCVISFDNNAMSKANKKVIATITVAVHSTCSTTKMGVQDKLVELAGLCANRVVSPAQVTCCGWAGDRGFFYPELNASGLHYLKPNLHGATEGYSNSRTCEIGLTMNSGISYKSIVYLVEKATR